MSHSEIETNCHVTTSAIEPLKIVLWSTKGAGLHYGGPGMTAYRMYRQAKPGEMSVTLAHGYAGQESYPVFERQIKVGDVALKPWTGLGDFIRNSWTQSDYIRRGCSWVDRHVREFDIFHGLTGFQVTISPALRAVKQGVPAVVKLAAHRADVADKPGLKGWLGIAARRRRQLKQLSAVIAISRAIHDELLSYGIPEQRIALIPNGVDIDEFHPATDESEIHELRQSFKWRDLPTMLFVGVVNQRKRPHLLVEAVGLLKAKGVACQLVLAGPPEDTRYIQWMKDRTAELGIVDLVHWLGFTENTASLYRAADLFALPSRIEGMPNALLEAMASGLPCIATKISGTMDLIGDSNQGRLVEPSAEAIAESVADYLAEPSVAKQHGTAGRELVVAKFSGRKVLELHRELFHRLIAGQDAVE